MNLRSAKTVLVFVALLSLILGAPAFYCLNVAVVGPSAPPIRVRQSARFIVTLNDKPAPGITIVVWTSPPSAKIVASLITDARGMIVLPMLLPGRTYSVGPSPGADPGYGENIGVCVIPCNDTILETTDLAQESLNSPLHAIDRDESALSEIPMEIGPKGDLASRSLIFSAEKEAAIVQLPTLRGVVKDPSGAVIPGAWVDVVAKGEEGKRLVLIRADRAGQFTAYLPNGEYVAIVSSQGFRIRVQAFIVDHSLTTGELQIQLDLGAALSSTAPTTFPASST